ncbi:flagellar hook-length control protein FliK [Alteromonas ponticola]|uniref:Flagellar hook-length control protein FliK n=1 Tax=Alteromonas ponticola TaxID=2720613 RepID=A0ABX1R2N2_9ALTE|nr:flagellar hook-length control protein FliK [Alteromonas ponticola]NMH59317.1 flagellar hook-length control protein FliK [Alteromonas ponticola]
MNFNIPLNGGGLTKSTDAGASTAQANSAAQLQARVALARLPESVMRIQSQGTGSAGAFEVKVPINFTYNEKAQHQLARTSMASTAKPVLVEHITSAQRTVISPEQASKIAEAVTRLVPASAVASTNSIQATVNHVQGNQLSLRLGVQGNPSVNITLNQAVNLAQGDKVQLTLSQSSANTFTANLASSAPDSTVIGDSKLAANHALVQQFTRLQMATGLTISPQVLQGILDKAGVATLSAGQSAQITLSMRNNQLSVTTLNSQAIAQLALSKAGTNALPLLTNLQQAKTLPLLIPIESSHQQNLTNTTQSSAPVSQTIDTMSKNQIHEAILQLSRRLLNEIGSTREALNQLITTLSTSGNQTSPAMSALMRGFAQQLTQGFGAEESGALKGLAPTSTSDPNAKAPTVQALQALFSSPSLPINSQALTSPVTQSGFVSGLVAVLQMTFAGRAIRNQPHLGALADDTGSFLHKSMSQAGATGSAARVSQEFSRLDGQRQMLENIKTLLANHRQQKLINLENRIQGQDSFYYVLPVNSQSQAPPEVLLKREEQHTDADNSQDNSAKVWNFTMKLDIDELGKLLVKSKVTATSLNLNLYTSSDVLLAKVQETLPILLKRLSALGLTIEHSSCQRGKIPETLSDNPYQLFETHA